MSNQIPEPETSRDPFPPEFRGQLIRQGDSGYHESRRVWNGMIDRSPAMIARCESAGDVVAAIRFAEARRLPVAVRGGGHSAAGLGVCDDGVVIDLSGLKQIQVDPVARTARAGGGVTWAELDRATQEHGLATTGGAISSTGIAGLTLGGGIGWLMRTHGLACDNLLGVELVTADGRIVHASATENEDLFWGVRGGGGNFGVVTTFEFQLHPVGPIVLGGMFVHPLERAREALRLYHQVTAGAPDELSVFGGLLHTPDGMPVCAHIVFYDGPIEEGEQVVQPLRSFGPPLADQVGPMPYVALQSMLDDGFPSGMQVYWRSEFLTRVDDRLIDILVDQYEKVTSPLSALLLEQLGGAVARVGLESTAFDAREADYNLVIVSRWTDPADAQRHIDWSRSVSEAVRPYASGRVYVNYLGVGESEDRVKAAYGPTKYARLVELKRKYDPTNFFRFNQNIAP
jgi:FAD/FMN-containing dehydrogenase